MSSSVRTRRGAVATNTYKIEFLTKQGAKDQLKFAAYYGKRIRDFMEAVKAENPDFYKE
ncbi:hypothetical protein INP83_07545 [Mucilaginibacter sp. 21P]|uniref:hypothetical protein n=1 Tax=Mucilaginibacter sp. 21P TaxID=2778902 RepID=UPI001C5613E3|nr:hypothetical protein [Mucilaginibacter sp. 21P]QXV66928.1 hypothetical protein INP83_07545 [Mucilaginibacter sp. 21P]